MAYKNIIVNNKNLSVIELSIDEDKVTTMEPEYFIENKQLFENTEVLESDDFIVDSYDSKSNEENEYDVDGNIDGRDEDGDNNEEFNLFS